MTAKYMVDICLLTIGVLLVLLTESTLSRKVQFYSMDVLRGYVMFLGFKVNKLHLVT